LDEQGQYHSKEHGETIAAHLQNQFWQYSPILEENCIGYTCLHFTPILFIYLFIFLGVLYGITTTSISRESIHPMVFSFCLLLGKKTTQNGLTALP
jgi:hypothetical protein